MGRIFAHITQFRSNLTQGTVEFLVRDRSCPINRDLPPGKTRKVKQSRILRCCRERGSADWRICILIDGWFTGMELSPLDVLDYTRIVITDEWNGDRVVCVKGVRENKTSDHLLRLMFFGCMRNIFWDRRRSVLIDRIDSQVATKLRNIEGVSAYHQLSQLAEIIVVNRQGAASPVLTKSEKTRKIDSPVSSIDDGTSRSSVLYFNPQTNSSTDHTDSSDSSKEERNNYFNTPPKKNPPNSRPKRMIPNSPPQVDSVTSSIPDQMSMTINNRRTRGKKVTTGNRRLPGEDVTTDNIRVRGEEVIIDNRRVRGEEVTTDNTRVHGEKVNIDNRCVRGEKVTTDNRRRVRGEEVIIDNRHARGEEVTTDNRRVRGKEVTVENRRVHGAEVNTDNRRVRGEEVIIDNRHARGEEVITDNRRVHEEEMTTDNRRSRGEEIGRDSRNVPRAPMVQNPMDSFVHVVLFMFAFIFICFISVL